MSLSEIEIEQIERAVSAYIEKHRPPAHIRPRLDLGFRLKGQSIEIFEIRPFWRSPEVKLEHGVAKATYVKARRYWKIFWRRQNLKWHRYDPQPTVKSIEEFLAIVERDEYGCFYG